MHISALRSTDPGYLKGLFLSWVLQKHRGWLCPWGGNFLQPATQEKCWIESSFGLKLFPNSWCVYAAVLELSAYVFHFTLKSYLSCLCTEPAQIQQGLLKRVVSAGFVKKDCAFLYLNCHWKQYCCCVPELTSPASHEQRARLGVSEFKAWLIHKPENMSHGKWQLDYEMSLVNVFLSTFHLHLAGICKWIWTALSFGLLRSSVHNEAIWEGRWKLLCILFTFVAKENNWEIHSIFICLVCWSIFVYWHDVYLNFCHDVVRMERLLMLLCWSLVMMLRVGEGDRYLWSQKGACLLGIKRVGLLRMGWRQGVLEKVSGSEE